MLGVLVGAFGVAQNRRQRDHTATSILVEDNGVKFHFLVDDGVPCVEKMINHKILRASDILFVAHSHFDHVSDLPKLVNGRFRGFKFKGKAFQRLPVIGTKECLKNLSSQFHYFKDVVKWIPIPGHDTWYNIYEISTNDALSI